MDFGITPQPIERYLEEILPPRPPVLAEMERILPRQGVPLIGPLEGQLLTVLARAARARQVLEIGTGLGYSTIWLALAVEPFDGTVTTVERDPDRANGAEAFFRRAGLSARITVLRGDAFALLPTFTGPFDVIFLDILRGLDDPALAPRLLQLSVERLRPGGLLIADNALVEGRVARHDAPEASVQGLRAYNQAIMQHPDLDSVVLPLRDGVAVSLRRP
ncbi:MAG TPA: O-methyltransferase [Chloroflexota bacterium]